MAVPRQVVDWVDNNFKRPRVDPEWLEGCYEFLVEQRHHNPTTNLQSLLDAVKNELLWSDLKDSMLPGTGLPPNIATATTTLSGAPVLVQITAITDIGVSAWSLDQTRMTREERFRLGATEDEGEPVEGDEEYVGEGPAPKYARSMLELELSDGVTSLNGMEYRSLPELRLGQTPLGYKMWLKNVKIDEGVAFLEPKCVDMIGYKCDDLDEHRETNFVAGLRRRMGLLNVNNPPTSQPAPRMRTPLGDLPVDPPQPRRSLEGAIDEEEFDTDRRRRVPVSISTTATTSSTSRAQSSAQTLVNRQSSNATAPYFSSEDSRIPGLSFSPTAAQRRQNDHHGTEAYYDDDDEPPEDVLMGMMDNVVNTRSTKTPSGPVISHAIPGSSSTVTPLPPTPDSRTPTAPPSSQPRWPKVPSPAPKSHRASPVSSYGDDFLMEIDGEDIEKACRQAESAAQDASATSPTKISRKVDHDAETAESRDASRSHLSSSTTATASADAAVAAIGVELLSGPSPPQIIEVDDEDSDRWGYKAHDAEKRAKRVVKPFPRSRGTTSKTKTPPLMTGSISKTTTNPIEMVDESDSDIELLECSPEKQKKLDLGGSSSSGGGHRSSSSGRAPKNPRIIPMSPISSSFSSSNSSSSPWMIDTTKRSTDDHIPSDLFKSLKPATSAVAAAIAPKFRSINGDSNDATRPRRSPYRPGGGMANAADRKEDSDHDGDGDDLHDDERAAGASSSSNSALLATTATTTTAKDKGKGKAENKTTIDEISAIYQRLESKGIDIGVLDEIIEASRRAERSSRSRKHQVPRLALDRKIGNDNDGDEELWGGQESDEGDIDTEMIRDKENTPVPTRRVRKRTASPAIEVIELSD